MKGPIQSLQITFIVHATEDRMKVEGAVAALTGEDEAPEAVRLEGHFGNEILSEKLHLVGERAEAAFKAAVSKMPRGVARQVAEDLGLLVDEHAALFLRLDKQQLVLGKVATGSTDPVRLKVKPRGFLPKGGVRQFYLRLLTGG